MARAAGSNPVFRSKIEKSLSQLLRFLFIYKKQDFPASWRR
jgi:hypothetical protein